MLSEHIELHVITPEREVLLVSVDAIELPGSDGYLGILPGHAPLLTELGVGHLMYCRGQEVRYLSVVRGYAEVLPERVIVLAEFSEIAEEIDVARAERARHEAEAILAQAAQTGDWAAAMLARDSAMARLQVAARKTGYAGREPGAHD